MPGWSLEKFSKNRTARSEACGCGVPGFCLIQSADAALCALGPVVDILGVRRISAHPTLRQLVMVIGPLRDDMRLTLIAILLKPRFHVRRDQLAGLWAALDTSRSDRASAPPDREAGSSMRRGSDDADAEASYDAAEGRGQKYSSLVNGCAISSEPTGLPSGPVTMLPLAVNGKERLSNRPYRQRIDQAADDHCRDPTARNFLIYSVQHRSCPSKFDRSGNHVHGDHNHVDQLDSDERQNDAAEAPDQQVLAQQRVGAERPVADPFKRDRNQATE